MGLSGSAVAGASGLAHSLPHRGRQASLSSVLCHHHAPPRSLPQAWYPPEVLPNQMTSLKPQTNSYLPFLLLGLVFCCFSGLNQLMKASSNVQSWCKGRTDEWPWAGMGMGCVRLEEDLRFDSLHLFSKSSKLLKSVSSVAEQNLFYFFFAPEG